MIYGGSIYILYSTEYYLQNIQIFLEIEEFSLSLGFRFFLAFTLLWMSISHKLSPGWKNTAYQGRRYDYGF